MSEENSYGLTTKGSKLLAYLEARQKYGDDVDDPEGKAIYEEVMQHIQKRRSEEDHG